MAKQKFERTKSHVNILGSLVDAGVILVLRLTLHGQILGDGGCHGGLTMVNLAYGSDVDVGFGSSKLLFSPFSVSSLYFY